MATKKKATESKPENPHLGLLTQTCIDITGRIRAKYELLLQPQPEPKAPKLSAKGKQIQAMLDADDFGCRAEVVAKLLSILTGEKLKATRNRDQRVQIEWQDRGAGLWMVAENVNTIRPESLVGRPVMLVDSGNGLMVPGWANTKKVRMDFNLKNWDGEPTGLRFATDDEIRLGVAAMSVSQLALLPLLLVNAGPESGQEQE